MRDFLKQVFTKIAIIHLVCWSLFIAYELAYLYFAVGKLEPFYVYLCYYFLNISFFYVVIEILNFVFKESGRSLFSGLFIYVIAFACYLILKLIIEHFLETPNLNFSEQFIYFWKFIVTNLARGSYFTILGIFYWAAGHVAYYKKRAALFERQQLIAEKDKLALEKRLGVSQNAYLKQQMNAHVLFNALNFIYGSVRRSSRAASECVLLLSDIMRFSLKETGQDGKIPLTEEITQLKNLVKINNLLFDDMPYLKVELAENIDELRIIPLILFSLSENVIKHGNLTVKTCPAIIKVLADEGERLIFYSKNLKKNGRAAIITRGIGLQNVRIRLDYAYAGNYRLNIVEDEDFYELTLTLNL